MPSKTDRAIAIVFAVTVFLAGAAILKPDWEPDARSAAAAPAGGGSGAPWTIGAPITYQDLTIFPVISSQNADTSEFETLDEALRSGDAIISEQGGYMRRTRDGDAEPVYTGGSQVSQLVLVNRGKRPLLLLAGEVVSGGKQDRIIGKDRIVPIGSAPLPLDVFCVEHGRWTGDSMQFSAAETMVHPTVRAQAAVKQDQSQVWAAVRDETPKVGQSESVTVEGQALQLLISAPAIIRRLPLLPRCLRPRSAA
ncbi:MAG: DUF6569 family protein [Candidatus Acidiferrales bacterium]